MELNKQAKMKPIDKGQRFPCEKLCLLTWKTPAPTYKYTIAQFLALLMDSSNFHYHFESAKTLAGRTIFTIFEIVMYTGLHFHPRHECGENVDFNLDVIHFLFI